MSRLLFGLIAAVAVALSACTPTSPPTALPPAPTTAPIPTQPSPTVASAHPTQVTPTATITHTGNASSTAVPSPSPSSAPSATGTLTALFFDVGESGDGYLIETPDQKYMLVDGGRRDSGIAELLIAAGIKRIDVVVATNPDADHIGGLIDVFRSIEVGELWLSGDTNTTITFEDFVNAVLASGAGVREVRRGQSLRLGEIPVEVLNPPDDFFDSRNDNSVALRLEFGEVSLLLTGDMEAKAEADLVASGLELKSTILKLGHHGSRTSTSPRFLAAVAPEIAVYQAGIGNRYGHPHRETLQLLAASGVDVYGTGANGNVVITTDGKTYEVQVQR